MTTRKQKLVLFVGVVFGLLFLWLAFRDTDLHSIGAALGRARLWLALPILLSLLLFLWFKALRWRHLLAPVCTVSTFALFPAITIGYAANIVLPMQLGELVRMYVGGRQLKLDNTSVLATIVLERVFDLLTIVALVVLLLLLDDKTPTVLVTTAYFLGGVGAALVIVILALLIWNDAVIALTRRVTGALPKPMQSWLLQQLVLAATALRSIRMPRLLLAIVLSSLIQWLFMGIGAFMAVAALGTELPLSAGFVVLAFLVAGLTLPSSPGFLGTIQLCFTLGLVPYGVSTADAFAASVLYHGVLYVSLAVLGIFFFHRLGYAVNDIRQIGDTAAAGGNANRSKPDGSR